MSKITYEDEIPGGSGAALANGFASRFLALKTLLNRAFRARGAFDAALIYDENEVVKAGGVKYVSLQDANSGNAPASSPLWWEVFGGGASASPATSTALGTVKVSVAPADPANPIAVGTNDSRLSDARTPTSHAHAPSDVTGLTEYIQDAAAAFLQAGAGISIAYDDAENTFTITNASPLSSEAVQDIVGAMATSGTGATATYDDAAGTLTIAATSGGATSSEDVQDIVAALLTAGTNVGITYNDAANTLTITASGGTAGTNGWAPILAAAVDGERRVLQVADWTGGTGAKPATGGYLGATGTVATLAAATDIRGAQGPAGAAGTGGSGSNATQIQGIGVAATVPTNGQVLAFNGASYAPTTPAAGGGGGGGAGNSALSIDVAAATSPRALTAAEAAANAILLTGARSTPLDIYPPAAGAWMIENRTGQKLNFLPAATITDRRAALAAGEVRQILSNLSNVWLSAAFIKGLYSPPAAPVFYFAQSLPGSGNTYIDQGLSGNNGIITGATWADGGLFFDGSGDYITLPAACSVKGQTAISFLAWYRPTATPSGQSSLYYESVNATGSSRLLISHETTGKMRVTMRDTNSATPFALDAPAALGNGVWSHIAVTVDSVTDVLTMYINGAVVATNSAAKVAFATDAPASPIRIGQSADFGNAIYGTLGASMLYFRALSASEVTAIMNGTQP